MPCSVHSSSDSMDQDREAEPSEKYIQRTVAFLYGIVSVQYM